MDTQTSNKKCPVTGLPIIEKPEWTNLKVANNYRVTFRIIGNKILQTVPEGNSSEFDVRILYKLREKVIQSVFNEAEKFVEIKDYGKLTGVPTRKIRMQQVEYFLKEEKRSIGFIGYNISLSIRTLFRIGLSLNQTAYPIKLYSGYPKAIAEAVNLIETSASYQIPVNENLLVSNPQWYYLDEFSELEIEFKVIKNRILYSRYKGFFKEKHLEPVRNILEAIFEQGYFSNSEYIKIADYKNTSGGTRKARKTYAELINSLNRKYNCYPRQTYIIQANPMIKAALIIVQPLLNQNYVFVNSLYEAFNRINQKHSGWFLPEAAISHRTVKVDTEDINTLVNYISSIIWKIPNYSISPRFDPSNPLNLLLETTRIVKHDFEELMEEKTEKENALEHSRLLAEQASKTKSEFMANISHEIRTPMNGILGMTQLALETELTPQQRDYIGIVHQSAESLLNIINDILDFSKIEAGQIEFENRDFILRDILENMMSSLAAQAHQKNLEFMLDIHHSVPEILTGDAHRFKQIVMNLVKNAIKFTEKGEILVSVEIYAKNEPVNEFELVEGMKINLHISVSDSGVGIASDKIDKIYEPFVQADGTYTRRYGGTGIGLSITKKITELMEGKIWVESQVHMGSTFHITPQFRVGNNVKPALIDEKIPNAINLPILIIDDNSKNCEVIGNILSQFGLKSDSAKSGLKAIEKMKIAEEATNLFRLILVDDQMPNMNGLEVARIIKQNPSWKDVPIILMTTTYPADNIAPNYSDLISNSIQKPIRKSELFETLKAHFSTETKYETEDELDDHFGQDLRILIVEDNVVNQKVAISILRRWGFSIEIANNGQEALSKLLIDDFDLVLMDIQMPIMDGIEATQLIRESKHPRINSKIPIIAMTAHVDQGDREKCLKAGMNNYVSKPLDFNKLHKILVREIQQFAQLNA